MATRIFPVSDSGIKERILAWADGFKCVSYLCPNGYAYPEGPFPHLLAVGSKAIQIKDGAFNTLINKPLDAWWFGYLGYDLKNEIEILPIPAKPSFDLPTAFFFEPEVLLYLEETQIRIDASSPKDVWDSILRVTLPTFSAIPSSTLRFFDTPQSYQHKVEQIRNWIGEGRVYEVNLCQFFESDLKISGLQAFYELQKTSPMPFSAWTKGPGFEIVSVSPERFLKKKGRLLLSQPMKGTAPRHSKEAEDSSSRMHLLNSEKERAENLMIVDLVRNDLARVSTVGSTRVDELFGIYSFPKVHQMLSTVSSELRNDQAWIDALKSCFPMGSMTGAPKIEAMKVIDELEAYQRGAFSGALGYIGPNQDFDFNVLIRSLFINHKTGKVGFAIGSAITWDSSPEAEWNECAAKASAMLNLFKASWVDIPQVTKS